MNKYKITFITGTTIEYFASMMTSDGETVELKNKIIGKDEPETCHIFPFKNILSISMEYSIGIKL